MLSLSAVPKKNPRIAARTVEGEALVLVIDRRELHRLNAVGTRVFELCDGARTIEGIAEVLVGEFRVESPQAQRDVLAFMAELAQTGAVQLSAVDAERGASASSADGARPSEER